MNSVVPVFEVEAQAPEMLPLKKRRGVTVITQHGRALSFGISKDRIELILETMALRKKHAVNPVVNP